MVYLELVKDLNCLFGKILWFWCHGSLDDVVKILWKLLINYWGFDVRVNTLNDSWVQWESMPCNEIVEKLWK